MHKLELLHARLVQTELKQTHSRGTIAVWVASQKDTIMPAHERGTPCPADVPDIIVSSIATEIRDATLYTDCMDSRTEKRPSCSHLCARHNLEEVKNVDLPKTESNSASVVKEEINLPFQTDSLAVRPFTYLPINQPSRVVQLEHYAKKGCDPNSLERLDLFPIWDNINNIPRHVTLNDLTLKSTLTSNTQINSFEITHSVCEKHGRCKHSRVNITSLPIVCIDNPSGHGSRITHVFSNSLANTSDPLVTQQSNQGGVGKKPATFSGSQAFDTAIVATTIVLSLIGFLLIVRRTSRSARDRIAAANNAAAARRNASSRRSTSSIRSILPVYVPQDNTGSSSPSPSETSAPDTASTATRPPAYDQLSIAPPSPAARPSRPGSISAGSTGPRPVFRTFRAPPASPALSAVSRVSTIVPLTPPPAYFRDSSQLPQPSVIVI